MRVFLFLCHAWEVESCMSGYVGRLAPSPTGALHLGNVRTFMIAWLRARSLGGRLIFRMEDLDHPKDKPGAAAAAVNDLKWLGFDWDEEYVQSERKAIYAEATRFLHDHDLIYPCVCSRKDVEAAQSAPHAGDQLYYPGTCRDLFPTWSSAFSHLNRTIDESTNRAVLRSPCWRFRVPAGTVVEFEDVFAGHFAQNVSTTLGDFPLARDEGGAGYTLAATLDDLLMGVTEVVRGDDLLPATPAQILLARSLRAFIAKYSSLHTQHSTLLTSHSSLLTYLHVPLVTGSDGRRLAKRHGDTRISSYREAGVEPEAVIGFLSASCGWTVPGEKVTLGELLPRFTLETIPHHPFVIPSGGLIV